MTIPPSYISADILPDKEFHLLIPANVTMVVEKEMDGETHQEMCNGVYMGEGKWYYVSERGSINAVCRHDRVTHWMVRP